jgi:hypothetical protein
VDWNQDGMPDLIHGNRWDGIRLYTGNGDGTLHYVGHVYDDAGAEIRTRYNSSPWLVDWDENGTLDLLLAGYLIDTVNGGILRVYPGIGDQCDSLVFDSDYLDFTWFYNLRRSTAQTSDLDSDGDKDLIMGYETGEVYFAENTGSNEIPRFGSYSVLHCDAGPINVRSQFSGSGRARPTVCDYNSDGILDLLVGCQSGWIYVFLGYESEAGDEGVSGVSLSLVIAEPVTSGSFSFDLVIPDGMTTDLEIRTSRGRIVTSLSDLSAGPGVFDISGNPSGIYLVTAEYGSRQTAQTLLVL